ncbi:MAG TPA: HAD hydrolase family protein [Mycobacteriales bacterium]|nr:HAD hydrolase family protein [Mycobacteriales bacterium]
MTVRIVYTDLDGTMVGWRGSFFAGPDPQPTLVPAEALVELHRGGVPLVLVSGRTRPQLLEAAALLGADGFIGELGAVLGWDRGRGGEVLRGEMPDQLPGTPVEAMDGADLAERLFAAFPGRLEWHAPWHVGHEADLMLRGNVATVEVHDWLDAAGFGWLRIHDNGVLPRREMPSTAEPVHVYHLLPDGIDKGVAVARDLDRRGIPAADAVAIGDSTSDLAMAPYVGRFFLVANGAQSPATRAAAEALGNVTVTAGSFGLGWAEAVLAVLSEQA